ncbi:MAG: hypothetical protein AB7S26_37020 [Sandaracinaceae bacterium]
MVLVALTPCFSISAAQAQDRQPAAVLATEVAAPSDARLGSTLDRALRARIEAIGAVEPRGSVALNLADVQLALSCEGESQTCLTAVCHELAVRYLVIPNLDRIGAQLVLSIGLFDSQSQGAMRRVERQASGESAANTLLDGLDAQLRELFGEIGGGDTSEPDPDPDPDPEGDASSDPIEAPPPATGGGIDAGRLGAAIAVDVLGLTGLGLGIGFGLSAEERTDAYANAQVANAQDAANALALYRNATDHALLANVFFVTGGVVLAAGLVWTIIELASGSDASESASLVPVIGPESVGLAVIGAMR